jgi:hypothetical protein
MNDVILTIQIFKKSSNESFANEMVINGNVLEKLSDKKAKVLAKNEIQATLERILTEDNLNKMLGL